MCDAHQTCDQSDKTHHTAVCPDDVCRTHSDVCVCVCERDVCCVGYDFEKVRDLPGGPANGTGIEQSGTYIHCGRIPVQVPS